MINARRFSLAFVAAAVVAALALSGMQKGHAQVAGGGVPALGMYSMPQAPVPTALLQAIAVPDADRAASQGPLARLVRNPKASKGGPPFALADQAGRIQRYVEPVPGIDLQPYIDQIVVVRHDTGRTLLATQLELPPQPLLPLVQVSTSAYSSAPRTARHAASNVADGGSLVQRAQFVDDDDDTVQLMPDSEGPSSRDRSALVKETSESSEPAPADGELPGFPAPMSPPSDAGMEGATIEQLPGEPMHGYDEEYEQFPPESSGMDACPKCGGHHFSSECRPYIGHSFGPAMGANRAKPCKLFADLEINFLRTHLPETSAGKLSEKYEFSPRFIIGFRDTGKADGRIRFWTYDRDTPVLGETPIRVELDVFDIEGTHSFMGRRSELTVGAGFRLAAIDLTDDDGDTNGADLVGMTLSAEGRAPLTTIQGCRISGFYGGRLSLLGGDWGGDAGGDFTGGLVQDDNVVVHELQAGFDVATCYRKTNLHARLGFEIQNWHSDALSQNAGTDSIGFLGPGIQLGAEF